MDVQQALSIVTALAHGANPQTGEVFASESVYQSPEVIRALFVAQRALEAKISPSEAAQPIKPTPSTAGMDRQARPETNNKTNNRTINKTNNNQSTQTQQRDSKRLSTSNVGKPWSREEDTQLLAAFDKNQSVEELARLHGRNVAGIQARLEKYGRKHSA
jgi:hypothetical protein